MAITGTGTGPFTVTGLNTESLLSIYTYVVAQNAANATRAANPSGGNATIFNCVINIGDGTTSTRLTLTNEMLGFTSTGYPTIRANAALILGYNSPPRDGCQLDLRNATADQFDIKGTLRAYSSRLYSNVRASVSAATAVLEFIDCIMEMKDGIGNLNLYNIPATFTRCQFTGASAVSFKAFPGTVLSGCRIVGGTYSMQPAAPSSEKTYIDTVADNATYDVIINNTNSGTLNLDGFFNAAGVPKSALVISGSSSGNTVKLRFKYDLTTFDASGALGAVNVRIRNTLGVDAFTGQTNGSGVLATQTLSRVEYTVSGGLQTSVKQPYGVILRKYDRASVAKSWACDNHIKDQTIHAALAGITLTEAQAAALTGITLTPSGATGGTVTVSSSHTLLEVWQFYRQWIATIANFDSDDTWTCDGSTLNVGAWNVVVDGAGVVLTGSKLITSGTLTESTGGAIGTSTYQTGSGLFVSISVASLVAGSRIQLYNVTDATQIYNAVVAGTSYSQYIAYTTDKTIRLRATKINGVTAKAPYEATGTLTVNGVAFTAAQVECPIYDAYGIDGSTVTGFTADYVDDEVDLTVGANFYIMELFAWWCYNLTTSQGISDFFGGITPVDEGNIQVNDSVVSIFLDNTTSTDVWALDNRRFFRTDGARPVKNPTTGGGGIDVEWREKVLFVNSGDITAIKAKTDNLPANPANEATSAAIKAKTDSLAFTVPGQVDANIQYVNDVQVEGTGVLGNEWGPA